jgi:hypothetical protein
MKKYKKCPHCGSEFVGWNWIFSPFWRTWIRNFFYNKYFPYFRWRFWKFFHRWHGECHDCGMMTENFFKVRTGIPSKKLESDFVFLPRHEIRGATEEFSWMLSQAKYFTESERHKYDKRMNIAFDMIRDSLDRHWKSEPHESEDPDVSAYDSILPNRTIQMVVNDVEKTEDKKE